MYCTDEVHPLDPETRVNPRLVCRGDEPEHGEEGPRGGSGLPRQILARSRYLIVSHERRELELWTRTTEGWTRRLAIEGTMQLKSGAAIEVDKLYEALPG